MQHNIIRSVIVRMDSGWVGCVTATRPDFCAVRKLFKRVCNCGASPNAHAFRIGAPNCACENGAKNVRSGAEQ